MFSLKGKIALVTGSGQGIGRSSAVLLASRGAKVIVNWKSNNEKAAQTIDACVTLNSSIKCQRAPQL